MSERIALTDDLVRRMLEARANRVSADDLASQIVVECARTPQAQPRWRIRSAWGRRPLAAASLLLVASLAFLVVAPALRPSVTEIRIRAGGMAAPPLPAGRYRTDTFDPSLSFTVPDGIWAPAADLPRELYLRARLPGYFSDITASLVFVRLDNVMTGGCGYTGSRPWSGGPAGPTSFFDYLRVQIPRGLGSPRSITIAGRSGLDAEFAASTAFRQECDYGLILSDIGGEAPFAFAEIPVDGRRVRIAAIDVDGRTVVIVTDVNVTALFDGFATAADSLLATMEFHSRPDK